jgi:hypothetical protein
MGWRWRIDVTRKKALFVQPAGSAVGHQTLLSPSEKQAPVVAACAWFLIRVHEQHSSSCRYHTCTLSRVSCARVQTTTREGLGRETDLSRPHPFVGLRVAASGFLFLRVRRHSSSQRPCTDSPLCVLQPPFRSARAFSTIRSL